MLLKYFRYLCVCCAHHSNRRAAEHKYYSQSISGRHQPTNHTQRISDLRLEQKIWKGAYTYIKTDHDHACWPNPNLSLSRVLGVTVQVGRGAQAGVREVRGIVFVVAALAEGIRHAIFDVLCVASHDAQRLFTAVVFASAAGEARLVPHTIERLKLLGLVHAFLTEGALRSCSCARS